MKKIVLFLLVGGFIASNLTDIKKKPDEYSVKQPTISEEVNGTIAIHKTANSLANNRSFLFLSLDKGKVKKAILTKMDSKAQKIEVAVLPKERMEQYLIGKPVEFDEISNDDYLKNSIEKSLGVRIDNILVIEKQGLSKIFSKIFPQGLPLTLTNEMKRDLHIVSKSDYYSVNSNQFSEMMKVLKQNENYDEEINKMVIEGFYSQLSKPEVLLSIIKIISDSEKYFFTDLTITDLINLGFRVMKNPIKDVQTLEIHKNEKQEVIKPIQKEWNSF